MSEKFPSTTHEVETPQENKGRARKLGRKVLSRLVQRRENRKFNKDLRKLDKEYAAQGKAIEPGTALYGKYIERAERNGSSFNPNLVALHEAAVAQKTKDAELSLAWDQAHATKELQDESKQWRDVADHANAVNDAIWNGTDNELVARDADEIMKMKDGNRGAAGTYAKLWDLDAQFNSDLNKPKIREIEDSVAQQHAEKRENELQ